MTFGRSMLPDWPLDPGITYLNHGTVGVAPREALDAQHAIREEIERQPARYLLRELHGLGAGVPRPERSRLRDAARVVAELVGARAADLVLVENATTAANAVLRSFAWREGDEILVADLVYGGIGRAAAFVARRAGARVRTVELPCPITDPGEVVEAFARALGPRTRLAIVDHIVSESSWILPVAEIARRCRARGVAVLADGAHAPGAIPLDIPSLGVDWYAANLHKWAFTPRPSGFLWAAPERQADLHPAVISWGLDLGFQVEFLWASTRDPSALLTVPHGIALLRRLGVEAVQTYNRELAREAARLLTRRWGTEMVAPESIFGCMVTVPLPARMGSTADEAARLRDALLFEEGIEVQVHAYRGRIWARISAQIYNDLSDIERLAGAVEARS